MLSIKDLKEVDFNDPFITEEQQIQAEYLQSKGYSIYMEGPYKCSKTEKSYCYIWAVNIPKNNIQKIDGRGYNIR